MAFLLSFVLGVVWVLILFGTKVQCEGLKKPVNRFVYWLLNIQLVFMTYSYPNALPSFLRTAITAERGTRLPPSGK